jgi:hypothetical protein
VKIHYFQRYHPKENVDTANAMLLLSRLYSYSSTKFFAFLGKLLPQNADVELQMNILEKSETSTPDATITQKSFKVVVETKLGDKFCIDQLHRHLGAFGGEDYNVLLTLSTEPMDVKSKEEIHKLLEQDVKGSLIIHLLLTFEELVNSVAEIIDERDDEMLDVIEDYRKYCRESNLISDSWKRMKVYPAPYTLYINRKLRLYYDDAKQDVSRFDYLGLYIHPGVHCIGKVIAVATAIPKGDDIEITRESGDLPDDAKERIRKAIEDIPPLGRAEAWDLSTKMYRYFFVNEFHETNFIKTSSRHVLRAKKFFDLCDVLNRDDLPETTEEIAELLRHKTW